MIKNARSSDFRMVYEYPEANTPDSVPFRCGRDVTLREQLYNEGTTLLSLGLNWVSKQKNFADGI
jgi:hypothetical protein